LVQQGVPAKRGERRCGLTATMRNVFIALCTAVLVTFTASSFTPAMAATTKSTKSSVHKKKKVGSSKTRAVQKALNQKGYKVKVDGKMGKPTQVALKKFQKANGLEPTGKVNEMTLEKLGFE
jgi:peptidoglycan hydrolase-like protein with peptidoglycan-binding domain